VLFCDIIRLLDITLDSSLTYWHVNEVTCSCIAAIINVHVAYTGSPLQVCVCLCVDVQGQEGR